MSVDAARLEPLKKGKEDEGKVRNNTEKIPETRLRFLVEMAGQVRIGMDQDRRPKEGEEKDSESEMKVKA